MKQVRFCLAAIVLLFISGHAEAQISPFRGRGPKMGQDDVALMDKAASGVFEKDTFTPGETASWSNPSSGWSGTVTAIGTRKIAGLACRTVDYDFSAPKRTETRTYRANWCRTPDGTWKLG